MSSAATIQTRCFLSSAAVAKEYWRCNKEGNRIQGAGSNLQAVRLQTGKLDGFARRNGSTTTANAGLGRFSGAIHGNSKGKSRTRRGPPVQQEYREEEDEHEDGTSGSDGPLTTQNQEDQSGQSTASAEECEAFAAAEGIISKDGLSDDCSERLSYNRYLQEIGVSPRPHEKVSKSEADSREFILEFHGMEEDESSSNKAPQLSEEGNLQHNGVVLQAGNEAGGQEDIGYGATKELDTNLAGKSDIVTENEIQSENEHTSVDKTSRVDANVFPAPEPKSSSGNEVDAKFLGYNGQHITDRIAEKENAEELRSGSDGGPVKKKRRKKSRSKATVESTLKVEERGDYDRVRASSGGAERPAISSDDKFPPMNGSVTASNKVGNFEPKMDFGTVEAREEEAIAKSTSEYSSVAESTDRDTRTSTALASVTDSNSTIDTSNDDNSPATPLHVLGKVGSQVVETVVQTAATVVPVEIVERAVQTAAKVVPVEIVEQAVQTAAKVVPVEIVEQAVQTATKVVPVEIVEQAVQTATKVVPVEIVEQAAQAASKVVELPVVVVQQAGQVVEILPDLVTEQVGQVVDQVSDFAEQVGLVVDHVSDVAEQVAHTVNEQVTEQVVQVVEQASEFAGQVVDHVSDVAEQFANTVNEQVEQVAESVSSTAAQVAEQVTEFFTSDEDDDSDSDDEFEAYVTSDLPEFRGKAGLDNFTVKQDDQGILTMIYDIYTYMLKQSFPKFAAAMFSAPILVSGIFTLLYLPEIEGLAFDETARDFFAAAGGDTMTLEISWKTLFQVFMFSLSLSTGLQPEIAPLSPYTLIVANVNALVAQLVFVFLSGAVFARLSQPSQPLRCSAVALVSASPAQRRRKENAIKVFMARYVLAGPQPCELVDVKVDLTYKYNTHTRTGSFFRATQSLKLVRPEIAFLTHGMLVRHVIDETSPLYQRTPEMLSKEDAVFCLSVVGLERASMQSVFHVQHYCVVDNDVIWDAEFDDIILINKKNRRVVDHSRLSSWRPFTS